MKDNREQIVALHGTFTIVVVRPLNRDGAVNLYVLSSKHRSPGSLDLWSMIDSETDSKISLGRFIRSSLPGNHSPGKTLFLSDRYVCGYAFARKSLWNGVRWIDLNGNRSGRRSSVYFCLYMLARHHSRQAWLRK